jgi:PIN domain nuclease of toxin-antitoxin system
MRLLLDTHVLLALFGAGSAKLSPATMQRLQEDDSELHVSVASLWEIAIKSQLGKLRLSVPLSALPELISSMNLTLLSIEALHVLETPEPEPATRDPFDRLLLAQCAIEGLRFVTLDRALASHPLAARI